MNTTQKQICIICPCWHEDWSLCRICEQFDDIGIFGQERCMRAEDIGLCDVREFLGVHQDDVGVVLDVNEAMCGRAWRWKVARGVIAEMDGDHPARAAWFANRWRNAGKQTRRAA